MDFNKIKKKFSRDGYIFIKDFFNEHEINNITKRCSSIVEDNRNIYEIEIDKLKKININKELKLKIIQKSKNQNIYLKSLDEFINFFYPILSNEKNKYFLLEKIHKSFCKIFDKKGHDIIFDNELSKLIIKPELIKILETILDTKELVYWCESGMQYNKPSVKGWHTDDPLNELNNNFCETFQVRIAIYFHSNEKFSGGIKFMPQSHNKINLFKMLKDILKGKFKFKNLKYLNFKNSKNYFPNKTDLLIWDKRLLHSPWASKLKIFENISLSPKFENIIPNFLMEPPCFPRSLLAFDIGKKSKELKNYLENWISIRKDYNEIWKIKNKDYLHKKNDLKQFNFIFDDTCINNSKINSFEIINKSHRDLLNNKEN